MPSERRLHPLSFLFVIAGQVRQLAIPGIVVLVTAGTAGGDWQAWTLLFLIPYGLAVITRYISFRSNKFVPGDAVPFQAWRKSL